MSFVLANVEDDRPLLGPWPYVAVTATIAGPAVDPVRVHPAPTDAT